MCWRIKIRKVLNSFTFDQTFAQISLNQYFELSFVFIQFKIKYIYQIYVENRNLYLKVNPFLTGLWRPNPNVWFLYPFFRWYLFLLLLRSTFSQKFKKTEFHKLKAHTLFESLVNLFSLSLSLPSIPLSVNKIIESIVSQVFKSLFIDNQIN
jgi:hypothetical protein